MLGGFVRVCVCVCVCGFVFSTWPFVDGHKFAWFINHSGCILRPCNNWIDIMTILI